MQVATVSYIAPSDFAELTKALATAIQMSSSDYVREKNERMLKERMVVLSQSLSARSLSENTAMAGSLKDGLT